MVAMSEAIYEKLQKLCDVLHWLGKYEEMQAVSALAVYARDRELRDWQDIQADFEALEGGSDER